MADFPFSWFSEGTTEEPVDELLISRSRAGGVKARNLATSQKDTFPLKMKNISATDRSTLQAFYTARRNALDRTFNFTWYGVVYVVIFGGAIRWTPHPGNLWDAEYVLLEV